MIKNNQKTWRKVKLGEVCSSVSKSFNFKKKNKFIFINTGDIEDGKFLHKNYFKNSRLPGQAKKAIRKNDILYSEIRPKNKHFAFIDFDSDEFVVSTKLMVIRNNEKIDPIFLYLYLTSKNTLNTFQTIAESRSGTFPQLTFESIANYSIVLPSLQEQKLISSAVSAFDDKIELNNKINQNLEQISQAIFKEWFVKFKFPGYKKIKFVDSEFGKIPEGWKAKKLGEIVKIEYGKGPSTKDFKKNGYPVYGANGIIGYFEKYKFGKSQIIIGCRGVVGSLFKTLPKSLITHNSLIINHANFSERNYLFMLLKNSNLQSVVGGSAQPQITIKELSQLLVLFAKQDIREKFEKIAENFEQKRLNIIYENQKLASLRDLLLPKLMSGEIKVKSFNP